MSHFLTRTLQALRLPLFCVLLWWLPVGTAQAQVSCTATMTNVAFGTVDLVDGSAPSTTATLSYTCTNTAAPPRSPGSASTLATATKASPTSIRAS